MEDATMEFREVEKLKKQLDLINQTQQQNLSGAWEWKEGSSHFFWTNSLFVLYSLPVPPDNLIHLKEAESLIVPADQPLFRTKMDELLSCGQVDFYFRILTKEEKSRRIRSRAMRFSGEEGIVFRGTCVDEAAQKELQQPLRDEIEKQALQLKVFERAEIVAGIGSWQINLETFETTYSDNIYRIYGLEPGSVPPHVDSFRKFIHPLDRDIVLRAQEKSYVEMIPLHLEYRIVRADGELRYIRQVSHLQRNSLGEHLLSGSTSDITEQKLLDIQLRETNEALQLRNELFAQAEDIGKMGTWQVNLNTRKTICCENHYRLYGLKPYAVSPALENFLQFVHPDDRDTMIDLYHDVYEELVPADIDFRIIRPDGKMRVIRQKCQLIQTLENERLITGVIQDITLQEQKDRQLKESYEKLAVQNEAFRQAEKVAAMGSWTWNLETDVVSFSENVYHIYGVRPQAVEPKIGALNNYIHPEDRKGLKDLSTRIRETEEPLSIGYRIVRPDGKIRHLCSRSQRFTSPQGKAMIIGTLQDITEDEQLLQQTRERVDFARMLTDTMTDRIMITDQSNNLVSWNKSCEQTYGLRSEEIEGKNFFDVFPQLRTPAVIERFKKALAGQQVHVPVLPTVITPGYHELTMVPFRNGSGRVTGILSILHDITRQHQLQKQLWERLQFIEKLQEASIDRIMVLDSDLHFQLWNRRCEEFYGHRKEEVVGKHLFEIFPHFKTSPLYRECSKALNGETVYVPAHEGPKTLRANERLTDNYEAYFIPLRDEKNEITGVLWIIHDLTEKFKAERELQENRHFIKEITDSTPDIIYVMNIKEPRIVYSNQRMDELLGHNENVYERGSIIFREVIHADDFDKYLRHIESLSSLDGASISEIDVRMKNVAGKWRWFALRDKVFRRNEEGEVLETIGIAQDITDKKLADEENIRNQALLKQAQELAHLASWEYDPAARKLKWSDEHFRMYGYSPHAFEPEWEFVCATAHRDDKAILQTVPEESAKNAGFSFSYRVYTADGRLRHFESITRSVFDKNGRLVRIFGTTQDITEHKLLQEQLHEQLTSTRLQANIDRQAQKLRNIGSWQWNLDTNKMIWGVNLYRLLGHAPYSFEPSIEHLISVAHPDDLDRVSEEARRIRSLDASQILKEFEYRILVNGQTRYVRSSCRLMIAAGHRAVVGSLMDITEDALLRKELAEKVQFVETLIDSSVDRIFTIDTQQRFLSWNSQCETTYGLPRKQVIGKQLTEVFPKLNEYPDVKKHLQKALQGETAYIPARSAVYSSGFIELYFIPLKNPGGEVYGVLQIVRDVTDRIQAEDALQQLNQSLQDKNRALEEMNEELTSFAFVASHDLREPLRKIQIFSEWISQKEVERLSEEGRDRFGRIRAAVRRMDTLIDDILSFSRINHAGKQTAPFDPNQVLENVKTDLNEVIAHSKAAVHAEPLPELKGNPTHFYQLMQNLISNALKYQQPGSQPQVRITCERMKGEEIEHPAAEKTSDYFKITVTDNGIGFEPQYAKKIFQMFQRLHGMHEYPGTGMGLAICRKIMKRHRGFISASGKPGEGAAFSCYFPAE